MNSSKRIASLLKKRIEGDVRFDTMSQAIYSVDASIFEIQPQMIALPRTLEDLITIVDTAREFNVPLTPRGGATGIAGGCLGTGIIIDTSKYLTNILEWDFKEETVICEPGVIQDQLNTFVSSYGYRLGPETSTGNRATIGGMCATNAAGAHYLKYGSMIDHVLGVEMILSSGEKIWLDHTSIMPNLPTPLNPPTFHRSSSGYPLYTLLETPRNLAKLTVGSEGTLGIFSKIKLKLSRKISSKCMTVLTFENLETALKAAPELLQYNPLSLELLDDHVIRMGLLSPTLKGKLNWLPRDSSFLIITEFENQIPPLDFPHCPIKDEQEEDVWQLRRAGLGLLLSRRSYSRAIAFIEDLSVPPENLSALARSLKKMLPWDMGIYGHAGDGCLHIRPYVNVSDPEEMKRIFEFMPQVTELVRSLGGVLSGEHGDGVVRSWLNPQLFSTEIYAAMVQVKEAFDPLYLMNPGKIVQGSIPQDHLRPCNPQTVSTFLDFEPEGGLHLAADLCNGNGACRKPTGLMCPSFQAYKDEYHSTRARAQSLRSILNGKLSLYELTGSGLLDVLDHCLQCKGCKTECPSHVDMAKMKTEMLYQYQEKHGYFRKNKLFGHIHKLSALGSHFPSLANHFPKTLLPLLGLTSKRPLPNLAPHRFTSWWAHFKPQDGKPKTYLFVDTFTEFYAPEVGIAAVMLLTELGYSVDIISPQCCGRPYLSSGMLKEARAHAESLSRKLTQIQDPIVVLEPSCLSAIQDDYPSLIGTHFKLYRIEDMVTERQFKTSFFYHPHCHEQALLTPSLGKLYPQMTLSKAGCCGLAGSFGHEKKHYEMSMAIANDRLFPQISSLPEMPLVASGFSCRQQIAHGLSKKALHPAQILLKSLRFN